MSRELTRAWFDGCKSGSEIVLEFLKQVKNIDFADEFEAWSNCDSFTNWKGEVIERCDALHETKDDNNVGGEE